MFFRKSRQKTKQQFNNIGRLLFLHGNALLKEKPPRQNLPPGLAGLRRYLFRRLGKSSRLFEDLPQQGIFMTGIESSDPFVGNVRRNQLKEAHDFYENFRPRLERISRLGIKWLRFGPPYSQTHLGRNRYDFSFMDQVSEECQKLGINLIADLLHFGLPEWLHQENIKEPYFQNKNFPERFADYAEAFARRYPRSEEHTSELQSPKDLVCR